MNAPMLPLGWPRGRSRWTPLRVGSVVMSFTLVGACQTATARRTSPGVETAFTSTSPTGSRPLVSVPNSGSVASVHETHSTGGLRQRIVFGQSRGRVDLTIASGQVWDDPAMAKPSRTGIAAELSSLEDGGSYRIVRQPVRNAYGPVGVAVNQRCAYAWQWIEDLQRVDLGRTALRGPVAVSLRVQHCARRPIAADALLADLANIRLGVASDATARAPRPRIARRRPAAEPVVVAAPVARPSASASRTTSSPPSPPTVAVHSSRTLVMLPPAPAGQSYLAEPVSAPASQAVPQVPRPAAAGNSPDRLRFLTDALPPSSRASGTAPQPVAAKAPTQSNSGSKPPPLGW